jgi:taurine dioxygenase
MGSINVKPLRENLPFGARVTGLTPENIHDADVRKQLNEVFEDRGMIVFENVEQTSQFQVDISEVFGPLKDHPVKMVERVEGEHPGVIAIRTDPNAGRVEIDGKELLTWQPWHFDHSYNNELNRAGVLRAEVRAPEGGLTGFADGIQLYKDLPEHIQKKMEDMTVIYTLDLDYSRQPYGLPKNFKEMIGKGAALAEAAKLFPRALHPAVWTRKTGEKVAHISPYGQRDIVGLSHEEGYKAFAEVWDAVEATLTPFYHQWEPGEMVIWDNWRMLHMATGCDPKYDRVMHRTTIKGDYGLGRWETEPKTATTNADAMS